MKKKVIIVGGGITGCVTALYLSNKKFDVSIYDQKKKIGGVLNDFHHGEEIFFNGCQYLNPDEKWFKKIFKLFNLDLKIFEHKYSSLTIFKNNSIHEKNYAIPIFNNSKNKIKLNEIEVLNLKNRINQYPKKIAKFLIDHLEKFNLNLDLLAPHNASQFYIPRVTILGQEKKLLKLKTKNKYDELFAVQRKLIFGNKKIKASIPKKGYDNFFQKFSKILEKKKVKIFLKKPVNPIWKNEKLHLKINNSEIITADHIIWTGNPTKLIENITLKKLDSAPMKIIQYSFNTKKFLNYKYTHIFSKSSSFLRFYTYKIMNKNKASLECIFEKKDIKKVKQEINKLLKKLGLKFKISKEKIYQNLSIRYSLITLKDELLINNLKDKTKQSNLICGPWDIDGRDNKINYILEKISKI